MFRINKMDNELKSKIYVSNICKALNLSYTGSDRFIKIVQPIDSLTENCLSFNIKENFEITADLMRLLLIKSISTKVKTIHLFFR